MADHVNYNQTALYVTDEDMAELQKGFQALLSPYLAAGGRSAGKEPRRMMLTTVFLPDGPAPNGRLDL